MRVRVRMRMGMRMCMRQWMRMCMRIGARGERRLSAVLGRSMRIAVAASGSALGHAVRARAKRALGERRGAIDARLRAVVDAVGATRDKVVADAASRAALLLLLLLLAVECARRGARRPDAEAARVYRHRTNGQARRDARMHRRVHDVRVRVGVRMHRQRAHKRHGTHGQVAGERARRNRGAHRSADRVGDGTH